ncbi:MAG TPA: hypothetical protein VGQ15_09975 [Gaiellaceae bacterium]|nr:hypothetical protein [Gaiellaceae bacterium]
MTELRYREGEPVRVRVRQREQWVELDDDGRAVELAGKPRGWLEIADRVVAQEGMNVNRAGRVFVTVHESRDLEDLERRLAESSLAVYEALLDELG